MVLRLFLKYLIIKGCFLKSFLSNIVFIWKSFMSASLLEWTLKDLQPEILHIFASFVKKFRNKPCFPDCWKFLSVVSVFKNIGYKSVIQNYNPIRLFVVVSNIYECWIIFRYISCFFTSNLFFVYLKVHLTNNKYFSFVVIPQLYQKKFCLEYSYLSVLSIYVRIVVTKIVVRKTSMKERLVLLN